MRKGLWNAEFLLQLEERKEEGYFGISCEVLQLQGNSFPTSSIKKGPPSLLSCYQPSTHTGSLPKSNSKDLLSILFLPHPIPTLTTAARQRLTAESVRCLRARMYMFICKHRYAWPRKYMPQRRPKSKSHYLGVGNSMCLPKRAEAAAHLCRPEGQCTPV